MRSIRTNPLFALGAALALVGGSAHLALATNGHVLHAVGSVNEAMGGAGLATSIDAIGSLANNVSSAAFLPRSSIEFGAGVFIPDRSLTGEIAGRAQGTVDSASRESVIPAFAATFHGESEWTFSCSALGIGGFGVDYPANAPDPTGHFNPLAAPQSAGGFGSIYSQYQLLQVTPSTTYRITPALAIGLGLDVDWASLGVDPWPATTPSASGYPSGTHTATSWGFGVTLGVTYLALPGLTVGASVKSPQWFDTFRWSSQYPDGTPTHFRFSLDYPLIAGVGASYTPTEPLLLALDVKWIDFADTRGFEKQGWAATPSGPYVQGFGFDSIVTIGFGAQYRVTPALALRAGYQYGQNPIPSSQQFFDVFAPGIVQHHLGGGLGIDVTDQVTLNLAYYHAIEAEASGSFVSSGAPGYPPINQPIPGTRVTNRLAEDVISAQVAVGF